MNPGRTLKTLSLLMLAGCSCRVMAEMIVPPELPLNTWADIETPSNALDRAFAPEQLKKVAGGNQYVSFYRIPFKAGEGYTFQTEYPGDGKAASVILVGVYPGSDNTSITCPSGTSYIGPVHHRSFPGGEIKGHTFGSKSNFRVSEKSRHGYGFAVVASRQPGVIVKARIIHPAVDDNEIKKEGGYRIAPDGGVKTSWGNVFDQPLWLGYPNGEPLLPFPWEMEPALASVNVDGEWETDWGDMLLKQEGARVTGRYADGNGEITGYLSTNEFSGYWIQDNSAERCASALNGRFYWGQIRIVFEDDKAFSSMTGYGERELSRRGPYGVRKGSGASVERVASRGLSAGSRLLLTSQDGASYDGRCVSVEDNGSLSLLMPDGLLRKVPVGEFMSARRTGEKIDIKPSWSTSKSNREIWEVKTTFDETILAAVQSWFRMKAERDEENDISNTWQQKLKSIAVLQDGDASPGVSGRPDMGHMPDQPSDKPVVSSVTAEAIEELPDFEFEIIE